jgi:hypothetical protein
MYCISVIKLQTTVLILKVSQYQHYQAKPYER